MTVRSRRVMGVASGNCQQCFTQQSCPVICTLGDRVAELQVKEYSFRAGDVLMTQGATSAVIRIIKSGATMLLRDSGYSERQSIGMFGRGMVIGSFGLLGRTNPVTHIGILEGRYCELSPASLQRSGLLEDPVFLGHMLNALAHVLESHFNWCQLSKGDGVVRRLAGALLHLSDLQHSLRVRLPTQTILAGLLGTTRESIARAFARIERDGGISRCGRNYCDLHLPSLLRHLEAPTPSALQ